MLTYAELREQVCALEEELKTSKQHGAHLELYLSGMLTYAAYVDAC